jgi:HEAT repeat protein
MNRHVLCLVAAALLAAASLVAAPQKPAGTSASDVQAAIDKLGSFDFQVRMEAARLVRRAAADVAVPALARAARSHTDQYVRYRALTLLAGFGGATASAVMNDVKDDRNDRLRTVVFAWFEHTPDAAVLPSLIDGLEKERSEFVRPALTRALAAQGSDPRTRAALVPLVSRGDDYFRGAVIEALGDYGGKYALAEIAEVAKIDGPLQDDAIAALGKIGDASMVSVLSALQKTASRDVQPRVVAALCLLGSGCQAADDYLKKTLTYAATTDGYQPLLRSVVHALGDLATRGRVAALTTLFDVGITGKEAARGPIALGVGLIALRQPATIIAGLEARKDLAAAIELVRDAFDMLNEDFEEERFYVEVRRAYWAASAGSTRRQVTESLIQKLEF